MVMMIIIFGGFPFIFIEILRGLSDGVYIEHLVEKSRVSIHIAVHRKVDGNKTFYPCEMRSEIEGPQGVDLGKFDT